MKKTKISLGSVIIVALLLLGLGSCKAKPAAGEAKPLVLASIHPYELLLSALLSPEYDVRSIIPTGASPHTWSPNPSDLVGMEEASLILINGLGLENSIKSGLERHADKTLRVEDILAIDAFENDHPEGEEPQAEEGHEHLGPDPHIWVSANNMVSLIKALEPELKTRFPQLADSITSRSSRLLTSLEAARDKIYSEASAFEGKGIITYHNSFSLFLMENGLQVVATVQSSPGTEPSAREMTELGRIIRAYKLKAIFVEPQMSRRSAEVLASEFNLRILELDPLASSTKMKTLPDFYLQNWAAVKQAFE